MIKKNKLISRSDKNARLFGTKSEWRSPGEGVNVMVTKLPKASGAVQTRGTQFARPSPLSTIPPSRLPNVYIGYLNDSNLVFLPHTNTCVNRTPTFAKMEDCTL